MTFIYNHKLITERNTGHTILDTKNVIVDCVHTLVHVTTGHVPECHLRRVDTREVQGTGRLRLSDVEAEWPCVHGGGLQKIIGETLTVHLGNHCVMVILGHVLGERCTVNVQSSIIESIRRIPYRTHVRGYKVESTRGVIEISE